MGGDYKQGLCEEEE